MSAPGRVITRRQWGAKPFPRRHVTVDNADLVGVEGHHSVTPARWTAEEHARNIESDHLGRGWNGPYYSWGIHESGDVIELRGWRRSQGPSQWRDGLYYAPVVFLMDSRTDELTEGHRAGWRFLRSLVLLSHDDATLIGWHNQRAITYCPGEPIEHFLLTPEAARLHDPGETNMPEQTTTPDPNPPEWAAEPIEQALAAGILSDPDKVRPNEAATRAEVVTMLMRGLDHVAGVVTAEATKVAHETVGADVAAVIERRVKAAADAAFKPAAIRQAMKGQTVKLSQSATIGG